MWQGRSHVPSTSDTGMAPTWGTDQDREKGLTSLLGTLLNLSIFPCSFLLLLQQLSEVTGDTACSEFPKMEHPGMTSPGEERTVTKP